MKKDKGQTLIEVLVGLSAAVVVMTAITTATLTALGNAQYSRYQDLANSYAQQGMELITNLHRIDYATFSSLSGTYCLAQSCNAIDPDPQHAGQACAIISGTRCPGTLNVNSQFVRTVTVHVDDAAAANCNEQNMTDSTRVDVTLAWNDQRCTDRTNLYCHNVTLSSCFNNAEIIPTP